MIAIWRRLTWGFLPSGWRRILLILILSFLGYKFHNVWESYVVLIPYDNEGINAQILTRFAIIYALQFMLASMVASLIISWVVDGFRRK